MKKLLLVLISIISSFASEKPNVLVIFTDDQSHRTVSCYEEAHDWVKTPNIDKLAESGIRFKSAYIGTWCMASRLTFLSGKLQHGQKSVTLSGAYPSSSYDPKVIPFWPAVFRKNGYKTAHIGKWHSGVDSGYGRDWDYQIVWNRPKYPENYRNYYYDQKIEVNGQYIGEVSGYSTDNYTKWSENYIRQNSGDKPWFLWVCYGGPHGPFTPAKRHLEEYPAVKAKLPKDIFGPRAGKPKYLENRTEFIEDNGQIILKSDNVHQYGRVHGNTFSDWVRQYNQVINSMDEGVGRLVQALRDTDQYKSTLIIFTSDQGFAWGQHGLKSKFAAYDAAIKAPLIISYPQKFTANKVCGAHVSGADIPETISEICGIDIPWRTDGRSILPLLQNPQTPWDYPVLQTFSHKNFGEETEDIPTKLEVLAHPLFNIPWWASLVQGDFKYIQTLDLERKVELYDLKNDPDELVNLADQKSI
jgi:arylsulfatase A-like enzyme